MNREILFRGKHRDEWVYGGFHKHLTIAPCVFSNDEERIKFFDENEKYLIVQDKTGDWWLPTAISFREIKIDTLGQYTGLKDKNGKKIFEGDIVEVEDSYGLYLHNPNTRNIVEFYKGCFVLKHIFDKYVDDDSFYLSNNNEDSIIVGNIHDNPELLQNNKGDNNE